MRNWHWWDLLKDTERETLGRLIHRLTLAETDKELLAYAKQIQQVAK